MKKVRFTSLPIYKVIRGSKLSKRAQDEILLKIKKRLPQYPIIGLATTIRDIVIWMPDSWRGYWQEMSKDSGL